jgi:hypothetical protein
MQRRLGAALRSSGFNSVVKGCLDPRTENCAPKRILCRSHSQPDTESIADPGSGNLEKWSFNPPFSSVPARSTRWARTSTRPGRRRRTPCPGGREAKNASFCPSPGKFRTVVGIPL